LRSPQPSTQQKQKKCQLISKAVSKKSYHSQSVLEPNPQSKLFGCKSVDAPWHVRPPSSCRNWNYVNSLIYDVAVNLAGIFLQFLLC
jgi:hypothetical protein